MAEREPAVEVRGTNGEVNNCSSIAATQMRGIESRMPSSVIAAMHYDSESRALTIVYQGARGRYRYFGVPEDVWAAFQGAPSKGTYLNEVFKPRGFRIEKVQEPATPVRL